MLITVIVPIYNMEAYLCTSLDRLLQQSFQDYEILLIDDGSVAALRRRSDGGRMERWLTGEEVCGQLRISPRTLQTLRDRRLIGYSQINRRFYYKPEEVKRLIPLVGTLYPGGK